MQHFPESHQSPINGSWGIKWQMIDPSSFPSWSCQVFSTKLLTFNAHNPQNIFEKRHKCEGEEGAVGWRDEVGGGEERGAWEQEQWKHKKRSGTSQEFAVFKNFVKSRVSHDYFRGEVSPTGLCIFTAYFPLVSFWKLTRLWFPHICLVSPP